MQHRYTHTVLQIRALQASMHQVLAVLCVVGVVTMIVKGEVNDKKILRFEMMEQYLLEKQCADTDLHGVCELMELEILQNRNCCRTGYVLHCRQLNGTAFLACLRRINCTKGQFAKLVVSIEETQNRTSVGLECQQCDNGTFHDKPTLSDKIRNNQCEKIKSTCTDKSLIYYDEGSASEDAKCACNFLKGYAPDDPNCKYFERKNSPCSCSQKQCGEGEQLSQNYTCEKKNSTLQGFKSTPNEFTNTMTTPSSSFNLLSTSTISTVNTTAGAGDQKGRPIIIAVTVVVALALVILVV